MNRDREVVPGPVLYVYYKLDVAWHEAWARRVRQFQAQLVAQWPGLVAELLQRPEAADGKETWMETYRHTRGLTAEVVDAIAKAAIDAGLPAPRHSESFIPLR
jgi:hypothetical protein